MRYQEKVEETKTKPWEEHMEPIWEHAFKYIKSIIKQRNHQELTRDDLEYIITKVCEQLDPNMYILDERDLFNIMIQDDEFAVYCI